MSNWKDLQFYCANNRKWYDTYHLSNSDPRSKGNGCPKGGGKILINTDTLQEYCTVCRKTWPAEDLVFHCNCGQIHRTSYGDSAVIVQADQGILVSNGKQVHAATQTEVAVVGQRSYHNIRVK